MATRGVAAWLATVRAGATTKAMSNSRTGWVNLFCFSAKPESIKHKPFKALARFTVSWPSWLGNRQPQRLPILPG